MRLFLKITLITIGLFFSFDHLKAQSISNEGTEFWVCFPDHVPSGGSLASMSIFITSKSNTSGIVSCGTFSQPYQVQANAVIEVLVPRTISFLGSGSKISKNKGIKVTVDAGKPKVVVYAHVFAGFRSAATLVLPYQALGSKHFAMSYDQKQPTNAGTGYFSQLNVVAADANVKVNIKPMAKGIPGTPFSITLVDKGDVYQYQDTVDITGTVIEVDSLTSGCKKIAAFSGSTALVLGTNTCNATTGQISLDPLLQQLYPIDSWGTTFPLVPFFNRNTGSIYRILASEDNTTVSIDGVSVKLNTGQFYSSQGITNVSIIKSDKPISVAQFALSQSCNDSRNITNPGSIVGDPDMVILNPLEYSIDKITLYSSNKLAITEQYLNITIPTKKVSSFKINGINFSASFLSVPNSAEYSYAQITLNTIGGSNFSLSADTGFNAIAYGFGPVESYAYSAGTSLASTTLVNAIKRETNEIIKIACINESYDFRIVLPYAATKLVWTLDANSAPITQNNPSYTMIKIGNKDLYEFKLIVQKSFASSGIKPIQILASLPVNSGLCSTLDEEIINFDFEVSDLPVAEFSSNNEVCVGGTLPFTYVEKNIGEPVNSWLWDFGDGTISTLKNPTHVFPLSGVYKVKLTIKSNIGCVSGVFEKSISVKKLPVASLETQSPLCVNTNIQFADKSTSADGNLTSWLWSFGDGTTSTQQNPTHLFTKSGTYVVSITSSTQFGCSNTFSKSVIINDPAEIDFLDPGACINDVVNFQPVINKGNVSSWLWNFGDGSNDVVEKVKQLPKHKYLATGSYNVTLQTTSAEGCISSITKTITISGANPQVSFELLDKDNLCSNKAVNFKNNSTILFGNITKVEIIYEYSVTGNNVIETDITPTNGEIYAHKYPASAINKNYQVVFRAYSGQVCFQQSAPTTITVNGSPNVVFGAVSPVCLNTSKFLLSSAKETTGILGTATLVGKGIVGNFFDPVIAGLGSHLITYTFTSNKGCTEQVSQTILVNPIPTVDAGEDLDILLAGEKQIKAAVTGSNLKYKWTPSLGLSADSILNPIASPAETTKYTLTVTSKDGCIVADEVTVTVHIDPFIPNVFSPNSDGINDTWSIKYLETFVNATIRIFNRYGQEVFYAKQYNTPWDGRLNNVDMPVGVYYFMIEPNNGRNRYTGSVTLLR
ncbi:PKD domain-containing protein [Pedobacter cryophilus]|uniref:PKD domain-containing protein n=1 Tax=Pedobacter cryophilus TaxID=2571271 RepID=A0A4U1C4D8_9SPHI|nr:PKD domain-containing protein [Pedobacter cryophilus]TKB99009.1 PKD domain-containing protein [Pedobacter cryophilus]